MDSGKADDTLFGQASALQRQNRMEEAIAAYGLLLRQNPSHLRGLNRLGICLTAVGHDERALVLFERACQLAPASGVSHFNKGRVLGNLGRPGEARKSLQKAVSLQPDLAMAWLHLGKLLAHSDDHQKALACFHRSFELSPDIAGLVSQAGVPDELKNLVQGARDALRNKYVALHEQTLAELASEYSRDAMQRVRRCMDLQHGVTKEPFAHPLQKPDSVYFPGLPPIPWFDREDFPWLADFENRWQEIRSEFIALGAGNAGFSPYVTKGPAVPDAMKNLEGSHDWDSFHFYVGGRRQDSNCDLCPKTAGILEGLPLASLPGVAPEAFFSVLRPGAHIRPHFGVANTKVAVHLPLIVPAGCDLRVGEETRGWREGECLIFDDSFEHEAWNRGDAARAVLIFEVWNPHLAPEEVDALQRLSNCIADWSQSAAALTASIASAQQAQAGPPAH